LQKGSYAWCFSLPILDAKKAQRGSICIINPDGRLRKGVLRAGTQRTLGMAGAQAAAALLRSQEELHI
jgi:hypothetical protein